MKIRNINHLGTLTYPDGRTVNIKRGVNKDTGCEVLFYLYRGKREHIGWSDYKNIRMGEYSR